MSVPLTRREVIAAGVAALVAACSPGGSDESDEPTSADGGSSDSAPESPSPHLAGEGLRSLFVDPQSVATVGRAAAGTPGAPDLVESVAILTTLGAVTDATGTLDIADPVSFAGVVRDQVRADYSRDEVDLVGGWLLARTQTAHAIVIAA